jgi:hypothetical protein
MINWKELEKFITPGKVCTLVMLIDGKEIGAFSFNIETLAYKEILESKPLEPVKVPEKKVIAADIKKAETERKESLKAKKGDSPSLSKTNPKLAKEIEPEPMDEEEPEEENDEIDNVDEENGEINEEVNLPRNDPKPEPQPERRLTRAEIMAQSEAAEKEIPETVKTHVAETNKAMEPQHGSVSAGPVKEPEKKVEPITQQSFGEEW